MKDVGDAGHGIYTHIRMSIVHLTHGIYTHIRMKIVHLTHVLLRLHRICIAIYTHIRMSIDRDVQSAMQAQEETSGARGHV